MVEAMQVAYDHSMAERLSKEMGSRGVSVEVYRFGIAGAPLTQYLWMVEREVLAYRPDAIVVLLIHNDFDESFRFVQGRYTSSFAKLRVSDGKVLGEIPPTPWEPTAADWIRRSASRSLHVLPLAGAARTDQGAAPWPRCRAVGEI